MGRDDRPEGGDKVRTAYAREIVTPSMIIRKCKEFIKMTDSEMEEYGRAMAVKINDLLTVFNFQLRSPESNKAIDSGVRLFVYADNKDYFRARIAGENIIKSCEDSVKKENEE